MRGLVAAIGIVFLIGAGVGTASARSDAAGEAATFVSGIGNKSSRSCSRISIGSNASGV